MPDSNHIRLWSLQKDSFPKIKCLAKKICLPRGILSYLPSKNASEVKKASIKAQVAIEVIGLVISVINLICCYLMLRCKKALFKCPTTRLVKVGQPFLFLCKLVLCKRKNTEIAKNASFFQGVQQFCS